MKFIVSILMIYTSSLLGQEVFEGYTLFTPQAGNGNSAQTRLIDNDEQIVHTWSHDRGPASMPYLIQGDESGLENTILVYPYRVPNPTMDSGGVGGGVQLVDWNSNVLWDFVLSNEEYSAGNNAGIMDKVVIEIENKNTRCEIFGILEIAFILIKYLSSFFMCWNKVKV